MNYKPVYRHKCNSKNMNSELIRQMFFFSSDAFKYQYVIDILHKDGKLNINYRVDDFGEPHQNYIKSNDNTMISEPFVSMKDIPKKLSKYRSYITSHCSDSKKMCFAKALDKCVAYLSNHGELIGEE